MGRSFGICTARGSSSLARHRGREHRSPGRIGVCVLRRRSASLTGGSWRRGRRTAPSGCWSSSRQKHRRTAAPAMQSPARGRLRVASWASPNRSAVGSSLVAPLGTSSPLQQRPPPEPQDRQPPFPIWERTHSVPPRTPPRRLHWPPPSDRRPSARRSAGSLAVCPRRLEPPCDSCHRSVRTRPVPSGRGFSPRVFSARSSTLSKPAWRTPTTPSVADRQPIEKTKRTTAACAPRMAPLIDESTEFGARVARRLRDETVVRLTTVTPSARRSRGPRASSGTVAPTFSSTASLARESTKSGATRRSR